MSRLPICSSKTPSSLRTVYGVLLYVKSALHPIQFTPVSKFPEQVWCKLRLVYLDFEKAFDSVSHDNLLVNIAAYRISGYLYQRTVAFLHNRKQAVRVKNVLSCYLNVIKELQQC